MMEQERLLIEAAQKDPTRFAELYETNFERVYAFIVRRVGDRHEAEDLTAEVFHHALENIARFEWRGVPFAVWLYRIAANAIADRGRKMKYTVEVAAADDLDGPAGRKSSVARRCFNWSKVFPKISGRLLSKGSSNRKPSEILRRNSAGRKVRLSSFSSGR